MPAAAAVVEKSIIAAAFGVGRACVVVLLLGSCDATCGATAGRKGR